MLIPPLPGVNCFKIAQHYLRHDDEDGEDDEDDDYATIGLMCDEPRSNSIAACEM